MSAFTATPNNLFFSRGDAQDPRLGEWVSAGKPSPGSVSVVGYADDRGIEFNGGRKGAKEAPLKIRQYLYKMTPFLQKPEKINITDIGQLDLSGTLIDTHVRARKAVHETLNAGSRLLTLGGGHDYGYPDGAGFVDWCTQLNKKPLIINFDAHLDVRPLKDEPHSGTPFYRLLSEFKDISFIEMGIQSQCNSAHHLKWAIEHQAKVYSISDLRKAGFVERFSAELNNYKNHVCFLSVDIDVFSNAFAPGCSQAWGQGLSMAEFQPLLEVILRTVKVPHLGVYEVSPPLDQDDRTSKLAAEIAHTWIFQGAV